jgi:hypothetical protein
MCHHTTASSLMMITQVVVETSVLTLANYLMKLLAGEYFIEFNSRDSFKL